MARLRYSAIASLDGYTVDASGSFDWAAPDEEVHAFVNDLERPVGTYLYGRRMYETMRVWQTFGDSGEPAVIQDFAADLAGGGQGGLLVDARRRLDAEDAARARVRRRRRRAA